MLHLPLGVCPMRSPACLTCSHSHESEVWRVLTTTDVENVTQGQGVPDHQVLPITGLQHFQAFCGGLMRIGAGIGVFINKEASEHHMANNNNSTMARRDIL